MPTYTCYLCKGVFVRSRPDQDAIREFHEQFPNDSLKESAVICHECFRKIQAKLRHTTN
jgi:hypothetical protein